MSRLQMTLSACILLLGSLLILWITQLESITPRNANAEEHHQPKHENKGRHNGVLLGESQAVQLELKTVSVAAGLLGFEIYAYQNKQPLSIAPENIDVEWQRLNRTYKMAVEAIPDGLKTTGTIAEPHSFQITLKLQYKGKTYRYSSENLESRVQMNAQQIEANQLTFDTVKPRTLSSSVQLPGKIAVDQDREAHVSPQVAGLVQEVHKHLGDTVKKGEVLARLNSRELGSLKENFLTQQLLYQQAAEYYRLEQGFQKNTARLLTLLAEGKSLETIHKQILDKPIGIDRSRLMQAYTALTLAEKNYQREVDLMQRDATTEVELQQANKLLLDSRENYRGVIEEIDRQRRLKVLDKKSALEQLKPSLDMARSKLKTLGLSAGDSSTVYELRSPINGVLISKHIAPGESVMAQEKAFALADLSSVWAEMMIPESQLEHIQIGVPVKVLSQGGLYSQRGNISHMGSVVDEDSRTAEAHAEILNPENFWKPGMFVTLQLETKRTPVKMAVQQSALQFINEEPFVFVRSGDQIQGFPVKTGFETREWVEITAGLHPGDTYVATNTYVIKAELEKSSAAHTH